MRKWVIGALAALLVVGGVTYVTLDEEQRGLLANMPTNRNVLFWPEETRNAAFRAMDALPALARSNTIEAGGQVYPLPDGEPLDLGDFDIEAFVASQNSAAIVVVQDGRVVFERYDSDFGPNGKWTSFSVAKSLTSTLVGAAIEDGAIGSVQDPVTRYLPDLEGSAYDGVTIEHLLTMSSGIRWNEDYSDPDSDVARFNEHETPEKGVEALVDYMRGKRRRARAGNTIPAKPI